MRRGRMENAMRVRRVERRKVQEAGDPVHIQRVHLVGAPGEAHRDRRGRPQHWIALPLLDRERRQQVVFAHHYVRLRGTGGRNRPLEADHWGGIDPDIAKKPGEMLRQKLMASDTEGVQMSHSVVRGKSELLMMAPRDCER